MVTRGFLGYVLVLLGGLVVSVLPGSHPLDAIPWRHHTPGRLVGLTVLIVGLGLAAWAWLELLRVVRAGTGTDRLPLVLRPTGFESLATEIWNQTSVSDYQDAALPALVLVALSSIPLWLLVIRPGSGVETSPVAS